MNILILNGSPKGPNSITLHTALYLKALHPEQNFEILHVGQRIKVHRFLELIRENGVVLTGKTASSPHRNTFMILRLTNSSKKTVSISQ